jgi:WD40 repeat protein
MIHDDDVSSVAFSPDGKYVVLGSWDGTARVWEAFTGKEVAFIILHDGVYSVVFSPDGKYMASSECDILEDDICRKGTAHVWEVTTGKEIARMTHELSVGFLGFSPDGKYLVSAGCDQRNANSGCVRSTVRVWFYRPEDLIEDACTRVTANFFHEGWKRYIGDALPYQAICPNLPVEPETMP